jgi:CBS-domain-containing membrane protein
MHQAKRGNLLCYITLTALNNLSYMRINLNIVYWPVPCNGLILIRYFLAYKNVLNLTCIYKTITMF